MNLAGRQRPPFLEPHALRERCMKRNDALKNERVTWLPHWRDIGEQMCSRLWRYLQTDRNKGYKRNDKILNNTPLIALRTMVSGLQTGASSPARQWFGLVTPDPDLTQYPGVAEWLSTVRDAILQVFARPQSNVYNAIAQMYESTGAFGTGLMHVDEDPHNVLRAYAFPLGQYCLANSSRGLVDTYYREFSMTVSQLVEQFGYEACSGPVQRSYDKGDYETWIDVIHCVEPNRDYEPKRADVSGKRYVSAWFEKTDDKKGALRVSGYEEFPGMAPRWAVNAEDVYGRGPGMDALGDCKALQKIESRKLLTIEKIVNPPMKGPSSMRNTRASILPGDMNYEDSPTGKGFSPAIEVHPAAIPAARESARDHEEHINQTFFADLWMAISRSDNPAMTAREIAERHDEKMLQLGPPLQRFEGEMLTPLIERAFSILLRLNLLPPPPRELQGQKIRVEHRSIMAQAQKILGLANDQTFAAFVGNIVTVKPDAMDNVKVDVLIRDVADKLAINGKALASEKEVAAIRAARAKEQQAMQAQQSALAAAQGAQTLSKADMTTDNALTRLAKGVGPVAAAAAGMGAP